MTHDPVRGKGLDIRGQLAISAEYPIRVSHMTPVSQQSLFKNLV